MAWTCVRCNRKLFKPREGAFRYAMEWRYIKSKGELLCEMAKLGEIDEKAVVTHLACDAPEVDGFETRMRARLKMPVSATHPLLA